MRKAAKQEDPTILIRQVLDDGREIVHVRSRNMAPLRRAPRTGPSHTIEKLLDDIAEWRGGTTVPRRTERRERIRLKD